MELGERSAHNCPVELTCDAREQAHNSYEHQRLRFVRRGCQLDCNSMACVGIVTYLLVSACESAGPTESSLESAPALVVGYLTLLYAVCSKRTGRFAYDIHSQQQAIAINASPTTDALIGGRAVVRRRTCSITRVTGTNNVT